MLNGETGAQFSRTTAGINRYDVLKRRKKTEGNGRGSPFEGLS